MADNTLKNRRATVIDDSLAGALAALAKRSQRSESAILRRALQSYEPIRKLVAASEETAG